MRIGHGFDVHAFDETADSVKPLILGGLEIPSELSLRAHSDGDVVLHALSDALLGAIAAGDIGQHFPDTDSANAGMDSADILRHCGALVRQKNYALANADITIVAQVPKIAPHVAAMRDRIAQLLDVTKDQVSVKATTTERLGAIGRSEGIAVHAVVLLESL